MSPLVGLLLQEMPSIIDVVKAIHAKANPDGPALTDAAAIAALHEAVTSTVARDDAWKAAHGLA